jgi:PAS domain S-box-containing protein
VDCNLYWDKVVESTYDGIIIVDADCKLILINSTARKILNINQQYLGEHIGRIIPSSRLPIAMKSKISDINRYQAIRDNLVIVYSNYPIFNEKKEVIAGVAVFRDLSGIDAVPTDVQTLKSLKETQIMMRAILDSTQDAVSVVDENGINVLVNKAFCKLTGWREEEIIGKHCTQLDVDDDKSIHMKVLRSKVPVSNQNLNIPNKGRDYIIHGTPIIVDNELKGSVTVIQDIAEARAMSAQLDMAFGRLKKLEGKYTFKDIVSKDPKMLSQIEEARKIASTPATILITGEPGTEIEIFAKAIHDESNRNYNSFIEINCAAASMDMLEKEIFGYSSNANNIKSSFERAENGTILFLNIDGLSLTLQDQFLKVLNEKKFMKPGAETSINTNARIIAGTHADLKEEVEKGLFKEDLFYRLSIFAIEIPPLRQRASDIKLLCENIIKHLNDKYGSNVKGISSEAILTLIEQRWKGNVRELESCLNLAMTNLEKGEEIIKNENLILNNPFNKVSNDIEKNESIDRLEDFVEKKEKEFILNVLCRNKGNKTKTARDLDISIRTLYYKMERYGIIGI